MTSSSSPPLFSQGVLCSLEMVCLYFPFLYIQWDVLNRAVHEGWNEDCNDLSAKEQQELFASRIVELFDLSMERVCVLNYCNGAKIVRKGWFM